MPSLPRKQRQGPPAGAGGLTQQNPYLHPEYTRRYTSGSACQSQLDAKEARNGTKPKQSNYIEIWHANKMTKSSGQQPRSRKLEMATSQGNTQKMRQPCSQRRPGHQKRVYSPSSHKAHRIVVEQSFLAPLGSPLPHPIVSAARQMLSPSSGNPSPDTTRWQDHCA